MSFSEKWQLADEFSVSKFNCDGNTLLLGMREHFSAKKSVEDFPSFFKINNKLAIGNYRWNTWHFLSFSKVFNKDQ